MLGKIGISRGKSFEKLFSLEILMKIRRKMFFFAEKLYERSAPGEVTDWQLRTFECRRAGEEDDPEMVERPYRKTTQTLYR
jgi:hypothetical protein